MREGGCVAGKGRVLWVGDAAGRRGDGDADTPTRTAAGRRRGTRSRSLKAHAPRQAEHRQRLVLVVRLDDDGACEKGAAE